MLKNKNGSTLAKRYYQVKNKYISKFQSINTKITMGDKKLDREKRTMVINKKFGTYGVRLDV